MKKSLLVGAILISSLSFGQKKNETSAAVEYLNKFVPALQKKDYATAKKSIVSAKEFIDLAAENPETKESEKTLYYKGAIYLGAVQLSNEAKDNSVLESFGSKDKALSASAQAFQQSFANGKKFKSDVTERVDNARNMLVTEGQVAFDEKDYKSSASAFGWGVKFKESIGELDSTLLYFAALSELNAKEYFPAAEKFLKLGKAGYDGENSYRFAAMSYREGGDMLKAEQVVAEGRKAYPNSKDLLMELVNVKLDAKDKAGAEKALSDAISADPTNPQLYYIIGTIYMEMGENAKAEQNLSKAIELKPDYIDAQYQLGAHYVSWGTDLKKEATGLKFGDAQYDVLMQKSTDTYKKAVKPLETYITANPKDASVLYILYQLNINLENPEKAAEYKKRSDDAKK